MGVFMDVSAVAVQVLSLQQNIALQALKQTAEAEAAILQVLASATLGQNLDISV